ncbi:type IV secretion system protein [Allosphingosinicella sp.]|jgi:type IV secretion system protein VirB6|uniref:type IV secretion system protein n=1 Tax=Allosphingosinicella sp. TaxID=2823234 RepID=UPI002EEFA85D
MAACPVFSPEGEFLRRLLTIVDCQAQSIGEGGYQALAAPGSAISLALAGLLTIFVALFGYRMMFGEVPNAREAVLAAAKVGVVLALATSWPAFRTLVYDVTLRGPAELAASIGRPSGLPGADGGLTARLQGVDNMMAELVLIGTGRPPQADQMVGPTQALTAQQQQQELARLEQIQQRPRWDPAQDAKTLASARTLYLTGAIAAYSSVRLIAGLLLALAPLFALFLLFDSTRGLFEGWVRGLAGAALGAVATAILLGVQLALMEPWLATVVATRRAAVSTPTVPVELLVMNLVFALTLLAALIAVARVAYGFRMPLALRTVSGRIVEAIRTQAARPAAALREPAPAPADERSRAAAIANAVAATQRREFYSAGPAATQLRPAAAIAAAAARETAAAGAPLPLGQSARRRTRGRVSGGALRRDRKP